MNPTRSLRTWTAGAMLAIFAVTLVAPAAEAGRRHKSRDDRPHRVRVVERRPAARRVVHVHRSSSDASAWIGFLGGIAVGALLSQAAEPVYAEAEPVYSYHDPYCHRRFASLESYHVHLRGCGHPRVVRVIEVSSGECVHVYRWRGDSGWIDDPYDEGHGWDVDRPDWEYDE